MDGYTEYDNARLYCFGSSDVDEDCETIKSKQFSGGCTVNSGSEIY